MPHDSNHSVDDRTPLVGDERPDDARTETRGSVGAADPMGVHDGREEANDDGLLSRLRLIEERPLAERADAYTRIHSELAASLEGGDPRTDG